MSWRRYAASADDTQAAGEAFASLLRPGDIVLLSGPLGAGKTTFTQGVGRGLGVRDRVTSPTFTIVRQHECVNELGIATLHHADVYRVGSLGEVDDLALGELVEESAVAVVEWGEIASRVFGRDVISVSFDIDESDGRTIEVDGALAGREALLDEWATPVNILAIETATTACAIALRLDSGEEFEVVLDDQRHHTETLTPGVRDLLSARSTRAEGPRSRRRRSRTGTLHRPARGRRDGNRSLPGSERRSRVGDVARTSRSRCPRSGVRGTFIGAVDGRRGELFVQTFSLLDDGVDSRRRAEGHDARGRW